MEVITEDTITVRFTKKELQMLSTYLQEAPDNKDLPVEENWVANTLLSFLWEECGCE